MGPQITQIDKIFCEKHRYLTEEYDINHRYDIKPQITQIPQIGISSAQP